MELNEELMEYEEECLVGTLALLLHQPPSVIRQQTYRDMNAVLTMKTVESRKTEMEMENKKPIG